MTKLMNVVKTSNLTVLMAIDKAVMEEDARKLNKLIKKRSNLIGLASAAKKVEELTSQINALRAEV